MDIGFMDEKLLFAVAVTLAVVEAVKRGLPKLNLIAQGWLVPWITLAVAMVTTWLITDGLGKALAFNIILCWLSAMGLWSGQKAARGK